MIIKKIKYIFIVLVAFFFFARSVSFSVCEDAMRTWRRDDLPGNWSYSWACYSNASFGSSSRYNNWQTLGDWGNVFLALVNLSWINCSSSNVASIQEKMQQVWWTCSTCIDWRAGNHMRSAINNCVNLMCTWDFVAPVLNWTNLTCSLPDYSLVDNSAFGLNYKCCKEDELGYEPLPPTITNTNSDWTDGVAHIVVQYYDVEADIDHRETGAWNFSASKWTISGASISVDESSLKVLFDIVNIDDNTNAIDVGAEVWVIVFSWDIMSMNGNARIQRNCEYPPDSNEECDGYGWNYEYVEGCCMESNTCLNPPDESWSCGEGMMFDPNISNCCMACNNPPQDGACQTWFTLQNNCCLNNNDCESWYYDENGRCQECENWTLPNESHDKCICDPNKKCCGIQLNTVVPFIWDCIEMDGDSNRWDTTSVTSETAFPVLVQWLMKILMSAIMVFSFLMVIVAWFLMTTWGFASWNFKKWTTILKNVIVSLILLWCSWLILSLINPSFFGG